MKLAVSLACALITYLVLPQGAVAQCTANNDCGTCINQVSGSMPWDVDCSYCTSTHICTGDYTSSCLDGGDWIGHSRSCLTCVPTCPCILGKCNDQSICGPKAACKDANACTKACQDRNGFNTNGCFISGSWKYDGLYNYCSCLGKDSVLQNVCIN
jgi:hypothetical protein